MLKNLGGSVTLEKGDLGGALFIISIPKRRVFRMTKPIEILIIEDDLRIADIHKRFIEKIEGFTVVGSAHTGDEAKDWIQHYRQTLCCLTSICPTLLERN